METWLLSRYRNENGVIGCLLSLVILAIVIFFEWYWWEGGAP